MPFGATIFAHYPSLQPRVSPAQSPRSTSAGLDTGVRLFSFVLNGRSYSWRGLEAWMARAGALLLAWSEQERQAVVDLVRHNGRARHEDADLDPRRELPARTALSAITVSEVRS